MSILKHVFRRCAAAFLFGCLPLCAWAQGNAADYPDGNTIHFVVPATPGGFTDVLARVVARHLSDLWHVPVVVDNKSGAGTFIGARYVIDSRPDGLTVLIAPSAFAVHSALADDLSFDPRNDLKGVAMMARTPSFLVVSPKLGVKTVAGLIAYAKSRPQGIAFGSAGTGSTGQLHGALFAQQNGFKAIHVPYRGTPEAVSDVIGGRVQYVFAPGPNSLPLAAVGQLVVLAASSPAGVQFLPGVPSVEPPGMTDLDADDWYGALVPGKTPLAIRAKLSRAIVRIMRMPDVLTTIHKLGGIAQTSTPEQFDSVFNDYLNTVHQLGQQMHIKLD